MSTPSRPITEWASKLQLLARENPTRTLLVAIGCGLAVGFLVHSLRPQPPQSRTARLLADVRNRLHEIAGPAQRKAEHLVENGASAVRSGVSHIRELHLERGLRKFGERFKNLFR